MHTSSNNLTTPRKIYLEQLQGGELVADQAQETIIEELQQLHTKLITKPTNLRTRLLSWGKPTTHEIPRGLYIWGGVGRGKTWLMDIFYHSLPFAQKQRLHFHHFMRLIHSELAQLKGRTDPLDIVATNLAQQARVLCLDEFHVSDIGDAMLLGQLLKGLFSHGITLVTTSNIPPDHLYKDGLQRLSFLPTIALLKQHTKVIELGGCTDFRLKYLELAKVYHSPLDGDSDKKLQAEFTHLAPFDTQHKGTIKIAGRDIQIMSRANDIIWFEFDALCGGPRSSSDYIEIARCYHTVIIANILIMHDGHADKLRRFMHLIDELYDRHVKLIISAETTPAELYQGKRLAFEYKRTASRLQEMQSRTYLARRHRP
ncbi:ATPase, AFG1 family [hydrothermal vent metagenome]|uniref:ATPase, AFG1 family n=1 Tax=hydrothermal vent metagenome TaxID=652676 RepID=A0A3B1B8C0_9ZZZZ